VDELRIRLAEAVGEDAASNAVAVARDRKESLFAELQSLRRSVAELEAAKDKAPAASEPAPSRDEHDEQARDEARARLAEVTEYARSLEQEVTELRNRLPRSMVATQAVSQPAPAPLVP